MGNEAHKRIFGVGAGDARPAKLIEAIAATTVGLLALGYFGPDIERDVARGRVVLGAR